MDYTVPTRRFCIKSTILFGGYIRFLTLNESDVLSSDGKNRFLFYFTWDFF